MELSDAEGRELSMKEIYEMATGTAQYPVYAQAYWRLAVQTLLRKLNPVMGVQPSEPWPRV